MKPLKKNKAQNNDEPVSAILPVEEESVINYDELDPDLAAELYEQELQRKHAKMNPNAKSQIINEESENQITSRTNMEGLKKKPSKKRQEQMRFLPNVTKKKYFI